MTSMQALLDQFANQVATEQQVVVVGSFQPQDVVRVHHNPTDLVLTNEHEGTVANSTVILLTDGAARAGLKFKPNTAIIRDRADQHISLVVASTIEQSISVEFEGYPAKVIELDINTPVVVNIAELFGIPMLASTASFFDVATGDNGDTSGWTLANCNYANGVITYDGGSIDLIVEGNPFSYPAFFIQRKTALQIGETVALSFKEPLEAIGLVFAFCKTAIDSSASLGDFLLPIAQGQSQSRIMVDSVQHEGKFINFQQVPEYEQDHAWSYIESWPQQVTVEHLASGYLITVGAVAHLYETEDDCYPTLFGGDVINGQTMFEITGGT